MDRFDFAIIGAGPAGEAAAYKARELGASVAIIDRRWFGGSCPHIGCLPSKSLLDGAARHHANPADLRLARASAARDYMVNRPADAAEPDDTSHRHAARGGRRDGLPRSRRDHRARPRRRPPRRRRPTTSTRTTSSSRSAPCRRSRRSRASTRSRTGRTAMRRWRASCRRACSSSAAGRPAASSPRSTSGSTSRRRSSSPVRGSPRPTTRATPRRCAAALERDGVTVRTGVRALRGRAGAGTDGAHVIELDDGSTAEGHAILLAVGRALPARRPRARALRHRHDRADAVPARRPAADRRRPVGHRRPGRPRAAHPPGALPGRARRPDGARRGRHARLPGAAAGDLHRPRGVVGRAHPRERAARPASTRSSSSPTSRRAPRATRSRPRSGT